MDTLWSYGQHVAERSASLNLVSPADRGRIFTRHVLESLAPELVRRARQADHLVDLGSGAGFPGVPLALACPDLSGTLVEPRLRRAQFLEAALSRLGLSGRIAVFHGTAERFAADPGRRPAGLVTARAVAALPRVWRWSVELLSPGGWLALFKGLDEVGEASGRLEPPVPRAREIHPIPGAPRVLMLLQLPLSQAD